MRETIVLGNNRKVRIVGVIKGLSSEREKVKAEFAEKPSFVALSISPEELRGLRIYKEGEMDDKISLSDYEEMYAEKLSAFGSVEIPPPCYTEAYSCALLDNLRAGAIDMDEEKFTNAYCGYVSGPALIRHSLRKGLLRGRKIRSKTPEEFVLEWDRRVNNMKGFRELENARENHMAKRLLKLSERFENILAFIELERAGGVADKIRADSGGNAQPLK